MYGQGMMNPSKRQIRTVFFRNQRTGLECAAVEGDNGYFDLWSIVNETKAEAGDWFLLSTIGGRHQRELIYDAAGRPQFGRMLV